jgi:hypothetical protein
MREIKLLGAALTACLALCLIGSATAAALENPEILPNPTAATPLKFTSVSEKGSEPKFESTKGEDIDCKDLTNKGEFTSARLGVVMIDFLGECQLLGIKCKTAGDTTGTILTEGDIHLVSIEKGTELRLAVAITPKPFTITCGVVVVEVKGTVIGLGEGVTSGTKTKTLTADFVPGIKGEQEIRECKLDKAFCTGKKFLLEMNFGEGFELANLSVKDNITLEKEAALDF